MRLHVEMIIFWIYWVKNNVLLKLISPVSFHVYNMVTRKFTMPHVGHNSLLESALIGCHLSKSLPTLKAYSITESPGQPEPSAVSHSFLQNQQEDIRMCPDF